MGIQTARDAKGTVMLQNTYRNKNRGKTLIDWDLNIYMPEELDEGGQSYWDPVSLRVRNLSQTIISPNLYIVNSENLKYIPKPHFLGFLQTIFAP